jgi:23S rRNA (guanosine2251-2'-O)-methyltransferase
MRSKTGLIFGVHPVIEAVESGKTIEKVFLRQGIGNEVMPGLIQNLQQKRIPFQYVPVQKLNGMTGGNHQGIIALIPEVEFTDLGELIPWVFDKGAMPALAVLDGITDVRNMGAIARSALSAGLDALVIPAAGSARLNADAIKASSGALHSLAVCREHKLTDAVKFIHDSGIEVIAASEKASDMIYDADFTKPVAFVLGAEDRGIDAKILKLADKILKIPIYGQIASLNVSVAASIFFYEMVRQRNYRG